MITIWMLRVLALPALARAGVRSRLTTPGRGEPARGGRDEGASMVEWLLIIGFIVVAFTGVAAVVTSLLTRLMGAIH